MVICRECGVELDDGMTSCPLCGTSVNDDKPIRRSTPSISAEPRMPQERKHVLQRILLQVLSVILFSGIAATLIIDLAIHHTVTWSVYSVVVCLIVFSYVLLLSLWHTRIVYQLLAGFLLSSLVLLLLNTLIESNWPLRLALPLLSTGNILGILLIMIIKRAKSRGLNVLALIFVGVALLCVAIEGIISLYFKNIFKVQWSVIVAACLLPVIAVIVFMHLRTKNNADLQKIFHT